MNESMCLPSGGFDPRIIFWASRPSQDALDLSAQPAGHILDLVSGIVDVCGGQGTLKAELVGDAFDAVGGVDVLDQGDLVACRGPLAGDDGGVG